MQLTTFARSRVGRIFCSALVIVVAAGPSATVWAQTNAAAQSVRQRASGVGEASGEVRERTVSPSDQTLIAAPGAGKIEAKYVAPAAAIVAVLRPAQIMSSPLTEMLPREVATAAGLKYVGFDPANVDEVTAFGEMQNPTAPSYGVTVNFNQPFKGSSIPVYLRQFAQLGELNGKRYLQSQHPIWPPSFYGPNNRTLVAAPDVTLRSMVEAGGQTSSSPLLERVRSVPSGSDLYVVVDVAALKGLFQMMLAQAGSQLPPYIQPLLEAPNLISSAELTVNFTTTGPTALVVYANDEAAATQLETLLANASAKYQENLKAHLAEQAASSDPIERALAQYIERVSGNTSQYMPTREGAALTIFRREAMTEEEKKLIVNLVGMGTTMMLPEMLGARQAARRSEGTNNLRQIGLAHLVYYDQKGSLPAHANYSDDGKPLLSWRVHILPYIEQNSLYQQFHLDEPWDSEHNKQLIAQMPDVFKPAGGTLEPGKTNYLAVVGEGCAFNGTKDGLKLQDITDGTSNTISVVEADPDQAVEWTKPDDFEFNAEAPKTGLGGIHKTGWNAVFLDGRVMFISNDVDANSVRAGMTRAGGEPLDVF